MVTDKLCELNKHLLTDRLGIPEVSSIPRLRRGLSLALAHPLVVLHYARYPVCIRFVQKLTAKEVIHLLGLEILMACNLYTSDFNLFSLTSYPHYFIYIFLKSCFF